MNDKFPPQRQGLESLPSLEVSMNQVAVRYSSEDYSRPQVLPKSYLELQTDPSPSPSPRPSSAASPVATNTRARSFFPPTPSSSGCQQQRHEQPQKISRSHTKSSASFEYEQMEAGAYRGGEHATRGYLGSPDAMCRGWDELVRYCQYLDAMNMRLEGIDITDVSDCGSPAPARFPPDTFNLHHSGPMKPSAPRSNIDFDLRHPDHPDTVHTGSNDNLLLRRQTSSGVLLRQAGSETASYGRSTSGSSSSLEHISRSESSPSVREVARKYPAFMHAALGAKKGAATAAVVHPDGAAGSHGAASTSAASTSAAPPKAAGKSSNWHNSQVERLKQLEGSSCAFR